MPDRFNERSNDVSSAPESGAIDRKGSAEDRRNEIDDLGKQSQHASQSSTGSKKDASKSSVKKK